MQPGIARIMVVEDEPGIREFLTEALSELGHVCLPASSGREALDLLRAEQVDLILMDIIMPGMSGLTAFKRVRERYPDTAVIFVTAMNDLEVAVEYLKQGAYDYLSKPITLKGLRQAVDDVLRKSRGLLEASFPRSGTGATQEGGSTATIMFTDLVGSTAMIERLGDRAARKLMTLHDGMIVRQAEANGGRLVKSMGDGFLMSFKSARSGVACAVAIQRAFEVHNSEHPDSPLNVRTGLSIGEPMQNGADIFGTSVNLAARISAVAAGGQVLTCDIVYALLAKSGEFTFKPAGTFDLKGISSRPKLYEVIWI